MYSVTTLLNLSSTACTDVLHFTRGSEDYNIIKDDVFYDDQFDAVAAPGKTSAELLDVQEEVFGVPRRTRMKNRPIENKPIELSPIFLAEVLREAALLPPDPTAGTNASSECAVYSSISCGTANELPDATTEQNELYNVPANVLMSKDVSEPPITIAHDETPAATIATPGYQMQAEDSDLKRGLDNPAPETEYRVQNSSELANAKPGSSEPRKTPQITITDEDQPHCDVDSKAAQLAVSAFFQRLNRSVSTPSGHRLPTPLRKPQSSEQSDAYSLELHHSENRSRQDAPIEQTRPATVYRSVTSDSVDSFHALHRTPRRRKSAHSHKVPTLSSPSVAKAESQVWPEPHVETGWGKAPARTLNWAETVPRGTMKQDYKLARGTSSATTTWVTQCEDQKFDWTSSVMELASDRIREWLNTTT